MNNLHKYFNNNFSSNIDEGIIFNNIKLRKCPFCNKKAGIIPSGTETITGFNHYYLGCINPNCTMKPMIDLKIGSTYKFGLQAIEKWNGSEINLEDAMYVDDFDYYASNEFYNDIFRFDYWYGNLIKVNDKYYEPVE